MKHECHPMEPTPVWTMTDEEYLDWEAKSLEQYRSAQFAAELDAWHEQMANDHAAELLNDEIEAEAGYADYLATLDPNDVSGLQFAEDPFAA